MTSCPHGKEHLSIHSPYSNIEMSRYILLISRNIFFHLSKMVSFGTTDIKSKTVGQQTQAVHRLLCVSIHFHEHVSTYSCLWSLWEVCLSVSGVLMMPATRWWETPWNCNLLGQEIKQCLETRVFFLRLQIITQGPTHAFFKSLYVGWNEEKASLPPDTEKWCKLSHHQSYREVWPGPMEG